ncbi:cellulase family glycosylhydrolase [Pluralibacter gergoviae]|nr:cellulase family glycosylhydrolase [Pluralibacter gergoviae]ELC3022297.1 cellulase family glycosylhydrolase [Pluralibacter gergoviae]
MVNFYFAAKNTSNNIFAFIFIMLFFMTFCSDVYAFDVGVCTHVESYPKSGKDIVTAIDKLRVNSIRDDIKWSQVESQRNELKIDRLSKLDYVINTLSAKDFKVLLVLSGGNKLYTNERYPDSDDSLTGFLRYVDFVSKKMKGRVAYYELWNEWTLSTRFKNGEDSERKYLKLVKMASEIIRKNDSRVKIIIGGVNPLAQKGRYLNRTDSEWLFDLIDKGIMKYADAISIHLYTSDNEIGYREPRDYFKVIDLFSGLVNNKSGLNIPIYVTEVGIPAFPFKYGHSRGYIDKYINSFYFEALKRSYIKGFWWYDLKDDGVSLNNKEAHFGLFNNEFSIKADSNNVFIK